MSWSAATAGQVGREHLGLLSSSLLSLSHPFWPCWPFIKQPVPCRFFRSSRRTHLSRPCPLPASQPAQNSTSSIPRSASLFVTSSASSASSSPPSLSPGLSTCVIFSLLFAPSPAASPASLLHPHLCPRPHPRPSRLLHPCRPFDIALSPPENCSFASVALHVGD